MSARKIFDLNPEWKFHDGDIYETNFQALQWRLFKKPHWIKTGNHGISKWGYDDHLWKDVQLPHDFVIERHQFSKETPSQQGYLKKGVVWYRKTFWVPPENGDPSYRLEFDGIFRDSQVWMNGTYLGGEPSGYTSFSLDCTPVVNPGNVNVIAVRVDASECEGWWYEGGGIYRDVRLVITSPLQIPPHGVYVQSFAEEKSVSKKAEILVGIKIENGFLRSQSLSVVSRVYDPIGKMVKKIESRVKVDGQDQKEIEQSAVLKNPKPWSVDIPQLYRIETDLVLGGKVVDREWVYFGIRTIRFDSQKGFFLNGRNIKLKGVCCHEDHAGTGVAVPEAVHEFRVGKLKEMGCNFYRTSHNPPSPKFLDVCDRMGMLVLDEARLLNASKASVEQMESMVKRDRNHPSVILWSVGNEEANAHGKRLGVKLFQKMIRVVKRLDRSRSVTYALNGNWSEHVDFHEKHGLRFDVMGFNYNMNRQWDAYEKIHKKYPEVPILGTENGSNLTTRGVYFSDSEKRVFKVPSFFHPGLSGGRGKGKWLISEYGETFPKWGGTPEETWKSVADYPFVSGLCVWTGFDYRGETYPFFWPSISSRFGIMDHCGFPKDSFFYYQAWWTSRPVLHIFPHWSWDGILKKGRKVEVRAYTNMDEVELFLNGKKIGNRKVPKNGFVSWKVGYERGVLLARGKGKEGVIECKRETAGKPFGIQVSARKLILKADQKDVSVLDVRVVDQEGRRCPEASRKINFSLKGGGRILGVGNGNPICHESDKGNTRTTFKGLCQVLVQAGKIPGKMKLTIQSPGLKSRQIEIETVQAGCLPTLPNIRFSKGGGKNSFSRDVLDAGLA